MQCLRSSASLAGVARFLLRSEAIASSMIEGISPSPQQVALAELAQDEPIRGFGDQARLVANNITILERATAQLVESDLVSVGDVQQLQSALLIEKRHHGLRTVQNWIGGSNWHPMEADFVPPPPQQVPELMEDLMAYLNGSAHAPLVQAALVHAQFETIHPFTDGNGRVGRALIHCVLARRRLTPTAMLPISLVLATLRDTYIDGLTAYRYVGTADAQDAVDGIGAWLSTISTQPLWRSSRPPTCPLRSTRFAPIGPIVWRGCDAVEESELRRARTRRQRASSPCSLRCRS